MSYLATYNSIPAENIPARVGQVVKWIGTEPRPFFAELRDSRPIFEIPGFTLVTLWPDVEQVLSDPASFSVRLYGNHMDDAVGPFMLGRDLTELNWREKSIMRTVLSLDDLGSIRSLVKQQVDQVLADARASGSIELVSTVGRSVPLNICDVYFGFPGPDRATMARWSKIFQANFFKNLQNDPNIMALAKQAGTEALAYLADLIASKRETMKCELCSSEPATILDRLLKNSSSEEFGLNDQRLAINVAGLLIGSVETTSQAIVNIIETLLKRPQELAAARAVIDTVAFEGFVWEALRFHPINPAVFRYTEQDTLIAGGTPRATLIRKGQIVFACTESAMNDQSMVQHPDQFIPGRPAKQYTFFGPDYHECLGKYVGQAMIIEAVRSVLRQNVSLLPNGASVIDFQGGPYPESFVVKVEGV